MRPGALLLGLAALAPLAGGCRSAPPGAPEDETSIRRTLSVGFVVVDGVRGTELALPLDVFHHTGLHARPGMKVFTVAPTLEPVRTSEGLRLLPDHAFADAPAIDVLVVPGAEHGLVPSAGDAALVDFVRERGSKARYVVSLREGAFVLARAGLLDGRACTTFPADAARLRETFPRLRVQEGSSFVHDGPAITSAGGAKSADAVLYLTELLCGPEAARAVARGLGIEWDLASVPHAIR